MFLLCFFLDVFFGGGFGVFGLLAACGCRPAGYFWGPPSSCKQEVKLVYIESFNIIFNPY